jgi:hypothetical protein
MTITYTLYIPHIAHHTYHYTSTHSVKVRINTYTKLKRSTHPSDYLKALELAVVLGRVTSCESH